MSRAACVLCLHVFNACLAVPLLAVHVQGVCSWVCSVSSVGLRVAVRSVLGMCDLVINECGACHVIVVVM